MPEVEQEREERMARIRGEVHPEPMSQNTESTTAEPPPAATVEPILAVLDEALGYVDEGLIDEAKAVLSSPAFRGDSFVPTPAQLASAARIRYALQQCAAPSIKRGHEPLMHGWYFYMDWRDVAAVCSAVELA